MFRTSKKAFQIFYYLSSLLPVYLLLLIFMVLIKVEASRCFDFFIWLNKFKVITLYKIAFFICVICIIISAVALFLVKYSIKSVLNYSYSLGISKVKILKLYNTGFREFLLSVILPLISTFSIVDYPITTMIMIILFQIMIFFFYVNSSDFFPNISLILCGFSVFEVKPIDEKSNVKYVFGKTKYIDKIIYTEHELKVVEIGATEFSNNVAVFIGG